MISRTKTRLSGETVAALTRKHFPTAEIRRIDELADGLFNAVYRISGTGALEKSVVLKVGPSPDAKVLTYERGIMKTEVEVCRLLQGSGVPVRRFSPTTVPTRTSPATTSSCPISKG